MTTRKYPRTINEAFPHGYRYASSIERPTKRERIASWALAIAIGLVAAAAVIAFAGERPVRELSKAEQKELARTMKWERAIEASFKLEKK